MAKTKSKKQQVVNYLVAHPNAKIPMVAEKFSVSLPTVYQYRRELQKSNEESAPKDPEPTANGDMSDVAEVLSSVRSLCQKVGGAGELRKYVEAAETLGVV